MRQLAHYRQRAGKLDFLPLQWILLAASAAWVVVMAAWWLLNLAAVAALGLL